MKKRFFKYFISNNWEIIFFTGKVEEYIKTKYKLFINGIKVKTKIIGHREIENIITVV